MRAHEFTKEDPASQWNSNQWGTNEPWSDGGGGGSISWQSKFKDKYGVDLPSDSVMASGMSGKKLPDLEKDPELKKIIKKPDEKKTAK